ncbi:MAG TPA: hypothetical protein VNN18_06745 [Candidatus Xenobia bacterium]|nr:hypothetical protein [Candidatus Xenobia bacterium]
MADARVELRVEVETEGAEQLTSLRRELEQLGEVGAESVQHLDAAFESALEHLQQSRQLVASTTNEFLQSHRQLFSSLEPIFQNFFQRILGGVRSFRDAFKRLLADLLQYFLRALAQMAASWLSTFGRFSGGSWLGSLVPSLGGTPPIFGGGGGSATNIGLFERLGIDLRGLGPIPGDLLASGGLLAALLGIQRGSPVISGLGGAAAGFAFGGPIGALIGGVLGFLGGLFSRGALKRRAADIAVAGFAEMRKVLDNFKRFQVDFQSALAALDSIWAGMVQAWREIGGSVGRRSIRSQEPFYRQLRAELQRIQKLRQANQSLLEALPIPEFAQGGLVDQTLARLQSIHAGSGKVLAFLHRGEAVLNARAVQSLGPVAIHHLNRAPHFQGGGFVGGRLPTGDSRPVNINVLVVPAPGMDERALAALTLRELERALRDRGKRL